LLENNEYENKNDNHERQSFHLDCLTITSLQLKPFRPLFVVHTNRLGQRMPLSHCPVPQINIPVTIPPIRQTFSVTSRTQYTEPPRPLPSSKVQEALGRRYAAVALRAIGATERVKRLRGLIGSGIFVEEKRVGKRADRVEKRNLECPSPCSIRVDFQTER
jgi:hypothetical protein